MPKYKLARKKRNGKAKKSSVLVRNARLSLLGKVNRRLLNASFPIYAVNSSLSTTYFSLGSSTSTALYNKNIGVTLTGTQEWVDINTLYTLYRLKLINFKISRSSNYAYTSNVLTEIPPVNVQISTLGATNSTQVSYSDNMQLINFYESQNLNSNLTVPLFSARCSGINDVSLYGPNVWSPLKISGIGNVPDIFFNIGFTSNPIFVSTASIGIYPVATVNYFFELELGAPTVL